MALKTALLWGGAQTAIRMTLSFVSIKVTAVYLGPAGLALVGQLGNFLSLLQGALGNAIQTGVVKMTAESAGDQGRLQALWGTSLRLAIGLGVVAALIVGVAAVPLSSWLLGDRDHWPVMVLAGGCIPLMLANLVFTGALNGLKQINAMGIAAIASALLGSLVFIPLCYAYGISGGLIGTVLSYGMSFAVAVVSVSRSGEIRLGNFFTGWHGGVATGLIAFYPMLLVHSVAEPASLLLVRDALANNLGLEQAGFWQATWRLSDMYTMVLTTAMSMYLMPHLSSIGDDRTFGRELGRTVLLVALLTGSAAAALYLLRGVVIAVVFTPQFDPVRDMLVYQLIGDIFKMAGWPIRMALVIKMRVVWYMFIEAGVAVTQIGLTYCWLPKMGTQAATAAYAVAWGGTLLLLIFVFKEPLHGLLRKA